MIYLLYGQPASGKTTIGTMMAKFLGSEFVIDGDDFRDMFSNSSYNKEGRRENIKNANAVATYLNKKQNNDIILCLVNPYKELRDELKNNNLDNVIEICLNTSRDLRKEFHVKDFELGEPDLIINTDKDPKITFNLIKNIIFIEDNDYLG